MTCTNRLPSLSIVCSPLVTTTRYLPISIKSVLFIVNVINGYLDSILCFGRPKHSEENVTGWPTTVATSVKALTNCKLALTIRLILTSAFPALFFICKV